MTLVATISPREKLAANASLAISAMVWATMFPATEFLLTTWDPFVLTALRLGLGGLILLVVLWLREPATLMPGTLPWRDLWLLGGLGIGLGTSLLAIGIMYSGAVLASIIAASSPIIATFMARFLYGIPVGRPVVAGAVVAVAGGVTAAIAGADGVVEVKGGEVLVFASMVLWVWYSQSAQRRLAGLSQVAIASLTLLTGSASLALALPLLMALGLSSPLIDTTPSTLLLILYIAAGPASFSITCWHYGVSRMGVAIASIYGNMVPVVVVVIAMIGGRPPRVAHLVGGALIIAGVLYAQLGRDRTS